MIIIMSFIGKENIGSQVAFSFYKMHILYVMLQRNSEFQTKTQSKIKQGNKQNKNTKNTSNCYNTGKEEEASL